MLIAAFSALGAVGTADLVLTDSSLFKIAILFPSFFLDGSPLALSERGEAYLSSLEDRYSIYLGLTWFVLGFIWVCVGFRLGYLQTHSVWLFYRLWSVTFRPSAFLPIFVIAE